MEDVRKIVKSIEQFGTTKNILVLKKVFANQLRKVCY